MYEGTCSSMTCVGGDNDSGTGTSSSVTFSSVNGTSYFIYVDGNGIAEGTFVITATCAAAPACNANAGSWN